MISDRLLDLMVSKLVFLTPSVSVLESRDRRVAQMFSTTFRSEYHSYSKFLQKESRERDLEYSARHATRAKPHLFVDPTQTSPFGRSDPNVPFLSTRPKPLLFVNPTQTSSVCQPDPNLFCLSTRPKPLLFVNPTRTSPVCQLDPNLSCLSTRPKPLLFVNPTQTSPVCQPSPNLFCLSTRPKPLLFVNTTQTSPVCRPESTFLRSSLLFWLLLGNWYLPPSAMLKFAPRIRLIITERNGVSCLV